MTKFEKLPNIDENCFLLENETYNQRKAALLEKINYLKNSIKNSNAYMLTSNNSILTKKGDLNLTNNLPTISNESNNDSSLVMNDTSTLIFDNYHGRILTLNKVKNIQINHFNLFIQSINKLFRLKN